MPKMPANARRALTARRTTPPEYPDDPREVDLRIDHILRPRAKSRTSTPHYSSDSGRAMRAFEALARKRHLGIRIVGIPDPAAGHTWAVRAGHGYPHAFGDDDADGSIIRGPSLAGVLCSAILREVYGHDAWMSAESADADGHSFRPSERRGLWVQFVVQARHSEGGTWDAGPVSAHSGRKDARDAARHLVSRGWEEAGLGWWRPAM
jgi:hypothetical protein